MLKNMMPSYPDFVLSWPCMASIACASRFLYLTMWFYHLYWTKIMNLSPKCFMLKTCCRRNQIMPNAVCFHVTLDVPNVFSAIRSWYFHSLSFLYSSDRFSAVKTVWERCKVGSIPNLYSKKVFPSSIERLRAWLWPTASHQLLLNFENHILSFVLSESQ